MKNGRDAEHVGTGVGMSRVLKLGREVARRLRPATSSGGSGFVRVERSANDLLDSEPDDVHVFRAVQPRGEQDVAWGEVPVEMPACVRPAENVEELARQREGLVSFEGTVE
jgi:hypothetical protein